MTDIRAPGGRVDEEVLSSIPDRTKKEVTDSGEVRSYTSCGDDTPFDSMRGHLPGYLAGV